MLELPVRSNYSLASCFIRLTHLLLLLTIISTSGCSALRNRFSSSPVPDPTPTLTVTSVPSSTPQPTETPSSTDVAKAQNSSTNYNRLQSPTPQTTIPQGFEKVLDSARGYSLALPSGWQELDLRGGQVSTVANLIGQGKAVESLQTFLSTEQGKSIGIFAATDMTSMMWGGFPTMLNVSVLQIPNSNAEEVIEMVEAVIQSSAQRLGDVDVQKIEAATVNNLPAVTGTSNVDLSSIGVDIQLFAKTVALLANERVYVLTLATPVDNVINYEKSFKQIIGSFRPE